MQTPLLAADQLAPAVSIVIPTYKHREFILETLASVWAQTFTDYEIIVVNDGSPDDTAEVMRPLAQNGQIRYFEQENQGQAVARNHGLEEARGEFIAFLDDDDLWPPQKLAQQIEALRSKPQAVLVYGYIQTIPNDGGEPVTYYAPGSPSGQVKRRFLVQNWIVTPGQTLIRTAALRALRGFDTMLWGVDDWDLYIRLADKGEFLYRSELVLYYREHALNASKNSWRMYVNARRLQRKHFGPVPGIRDLGVWWKSRQFLSKYADGMAESAHQMALRGHKWQACRMWFKSIGMQQHILTRTTGHTLFKCILPLLWTQSGKDSG